MSPHRRRLAAGAARRRVFVARGTGVCCLGSGSRMCRLGAVPLPPFSQWYRLDAGRAEASCVGAPHRVTNAGVPVDGLTNRGNLTGRGLYRVIRKNRNQTFEKGDHKGSVK